MKKIIALCLLLSSQVMASMPGCTTAGPPLYLQIPGYGASGDQFSKALAFDFNLLSTTTALYVTTTSIMVPYVGATKTVDLGIWGVTGSSDVTMAHFIGDGTSLSGVLHSYSESDPIFTGSAAQGITSGNISNWNTAYGWGAPYITSTKTIVDTLALRLTSPATFYIVKNSDYLVNPATFTIQDLANATSANTANAIVKRNSAGNFYSGAINISSATTTGDLTIGGTTYASGSIYQGSYESDDGLDLYWPFKENIGNSAHDYGPNAFDGLFSVSSAVWTTGKSGYGVQLNGYGNVTYTGNIGIGASDPVTTEAWIYFSTTAKECGGYVYLFTGLYMHSANNYIYITPGGANYWPVSGTALVGNWHHFCMTKTGLGHYSAHLYVDGIDYGIPLQSESNFGAFTNFSITGPSGCTNQTLTTAFDEVRVFNRALSADEVRMQYLRGLNSHAVIKTNTFRILNNSANELMRVNSSGNVGIGSTNPSALLHISSTTASASQFMIKVTTGTTNANVFNILGNGYVGIGTTNPATALNVNGTVTATDYTGKANYVSSLTASSATVTGNLMAGQRIVISTNNYNGPEIGRLIFQSINNNNQQIPYASIRGGFSNGVWQAEDGNIAFYTERVGTETLHTFWKSDGKLGIGTSAPSRLLHVNGDFQTEGYNQFNSTLTCIGPENFYNTATFYGNMVTQGINAGDILATSLTGTHYGDGTNLSGVVTLAGSNYYTGLNEFSLQTTLDGLTFMDHIQFKNGAASTIFDTDLKSIVMNGLQVNLSRDYAYNWVKASTASITALYYDVGLDIGQYMRFDKYGLVISSGLRAGASRVDGSGGVNIINSDGKIPAISSTYFANLSGANLTGLPGDSTKLPLGGGTITGSLIFEPTAISTGQLIFQGGYPHSIQFNNQSATSGAEFLGEIQFLQSGTGKKRIISYGDTHASYPKELQIGADSTGAGANIRITGNTSMNPDLYVSSWASIGINTATPNPTYFLDVNGKINASGVYKNGVEIVPVGDAASLTSTQTFTGANTFKSSVTVNGSMYLNNSVTASSFTTTSVPTIPGVLSRFYVYTATDNYTNFEVGLTSLDYSKYDYWELVFLASSTATGNSNINLFFNSDFTQTDYYSSFYEAGAASGRNNAPTVGYIGYGVGGNAAMFSCKIVIDPAGYARADCLENRFNVGNVISGRRSMVKNAPVGNITSMRFNCSDATGCIGSGTKIILMGVLK